MKQFSISPREMIISAWNNKRLLYSLIKRDINGRYRGSMMGLLWSFVNPILMLTVYTFVFSVVFKARWSTGGESKTEFALVLFAGLMVFNFFNECVNRAPNLILANVNYVKKVVFPLEILPWVSLGSALFHLIISLGVWLVFYLLLFGMPPITLVLFPTVFLPFMMFTMGLSWLLASLGVYLRDVSQIIGIFTTTLMFISPIFYPASALPGEYQSLLFWNPITQAVEQARDVLIWGRMPDWVSYTSYAVWTFLFAWVGFAWFQKTRKGFADVI